MAAKPIARLDRRIGVGLLTLYGVGVMVGAGIYVLIGQVAGETGVFAPLAFLVAGLLAAPTAISYAELSVRIPQSAGEAAYVREATGRIDLAILTGCAVVAVGVISAAVVLQGGVGYLAALVDLPRPVMIVAIGMALCLAAIAGVVESLALAAILTAIEIVGLVIVIGVGLTGPVALPAVPEFDISGLAAAALLAFFAFLGFEDMVNMAEETRDPDRTLPRAIFGALALTTIIYILVAWAAVRTVPAGDLQASDKPLALVFETATGKGAGFLAAIAVCAALNGVLAQIVMVARVLFGLGRHSQVFAVFHRTSPRLKTPVLATLAATAAVLTLALGFPLVALAELTSLILLGIFGAINLTVIALRRQTRGAAGHKAGRLPGRKGFAAPRWVAYAGAILSFGALIWGLIA